MEEIVNKVAASGLETINLEDYFPQGETLVFDMKDHLFMGMILKEKDFRAALQELDWTPFQDKNVAILCSVDAIIPSWAYMLVMTYLEPVASFALAGSIELLHAVQFLQRLQTLPIANFVDKRVVIKGCGDLPIGALAYTEITRLLKPVVKSIMYGEPCSTVPVYKRK
ncbi:Protein of unknown function [Chitinophaga costaii]|uniref:DUF2480 family protein n=1 Tax=Chitinophaga costaii TaxID=1335309 RepID=A0A1C4AI23_9BACT|nr:DUF2480 family protein [Chitinophaga costaii]PUZ26612.1 DUF2480 domain-containing protein [Chitinophaga costaii]SCB94248.1 Protein of unknown function [Chitinophaga costaii]